MREKLHETLHNIIEHTSCIINDILENHKLTSKTLCDLSQHIDNLEDAVCMHVKMFGTDSEMNGEEVAANTVKPMTKTSVVMKPTVTVADK